MSIKTTIIAALLANSLLANIQFYGFSKKPQTSQISEQIVHIEDIALIFNKYLGLPFAISTQALPKVDLNAKVHKNIRTIYTPIGAVHIIDKIIIQRPVSSLALFQ